jgi:hypothetical protein
MPQRSSVPIVVLSAARTAVYGYSRVLGPVNSGKLASGGCVGPGRTLSTPTHCLKSRLSFEIAGPQGQKEGRPKRVQPA